MRTSLVTLVALLGAGCTAAPSATDAASSASAERLSAACASNWYADRDGDGYGTPKAVKRACGAPGGFVANSSDCDDRLALRHPGADEVCDGRDQDCDNLIDEEAIDAGSYYADLDEDGYGDPLSRIDACDAPAGHVTDDSDCGDGSALIYPGAPEVCNDSDDDCDGATDEEVCTVSEESDTEICGDGVDQDADGIGCEPRGIFELDNSVLWASAMTGSGTGWDLEYAGDVDNDGNADWLTGGPAFWSGDVGETRLVYGTGVTTAGPQPLSAQAGFQGSAAGDSAGYASAPAGDVDNDGYDDFIVTAPSSDGVAEDSGGAYLVYGGASRYTGDTAMTSIGARFLGGAEFDYAGASVMSGHFDDDAYSDFAIGSAGADVGGVEDAGSVYVYYGDAAPYAGEYGLAATANATIHGTATWTAMADPNAIAAADLDGDGMDDLLVGAWDFSEARLGADVFLFYGDAGGLSGNVPVTAADAQFHGTVGWWSYIEIAGAGDVDGDGYEEFLIGLPDQLAGEAGAAYLFSGSATRRSGPVEDSSADAIFQGSADDDYELTVDGGDLNGDGLSDVFVGSPWNSTMGEGAGAVYAWYGEEMSGTYAASTADATWYGAVTDRRLGSDLAASGDIDGDGDADLLMGGFGEAGSDGAAWLVFGSGF